MAESAMINAATARQLAGGVSIATIKRWMADGIIPQSVKIRKRHWWDRAAFVKAINKAGQS